MSGYVTVINGTYTCPVTMRVYQVRKLNGEPVTESYRGPGVMRGRRLTIGAPTAVHLFEYLVDDKPVPGTEEREAGYAKGLLAQRKRYGAGWTDDFKAGYQEAWVEREEGRITRSWYISDALKELHALPDWNASQRRRYAHLTALNQLT